MVTHIFEQSKDFLYLCVAKELYSYELKTLKLKVSYLNVHYKTDTINDGV
jgi:hypothetical protein